MKYLLTFALIGLASTAHAQDGYRFKPPVGGPTYSDKQRADELPHSASTYASRAQDAADEHRADILRRLDASNAQFARDNPQRVAKPMSADDALVQTCLNFGVRTPSTLKQCVEVARTQPGFPENAIQDWRMSIRRWCATQARELESCEYQITGISSYGVSSWESAREYNRAIRTIERYGKN